MSDTLATTDWQRIRYANCWEDADILVEALRPGTGRRMLSIASGGDNAFALLAEGAEVVAVDLSPAQLALVELKREAIRHLGREHCLAFLGLRPTPDRPATFRELRNALSDEARAYWEHHAETLCHGVVHAGKFERYFRTFRRVVLPLVHSHRTVEDCLTARPPDERRRFYDCTWDNRRWRILFRLFFSRAVMGRLGRDPAFFEHVEGTVADRILGRTRYALTELETQDNPYLRYILTGTFGGCPPRYLRPAVYDRVKANLGSLLLCQGDLGAVARSHAGDGFDGFNLSDVFEYLSEEDTERLYGTLLEAARPGARLAYWNMLAPRSCPSAFRNRVEPLEDLSSALFARDKAFFYSRFVVEQCNP